MAEVSVPGPDLTVQSLGLSGLNCGGIVGHGPREAAMTGGHVVGRDEGEVYDLGILTMRVLADAKTSQGTLAVLEFRGGAGPWTVPHAHHQMEESFYVLDGTFDFVCGDAEITATQGDYILVPRGTTHMITAHEGGGALSGSTLQPAWKTCSGP
jgi:mannose-6-phosphate isomerase-like protein (cupin superfamily)